MMGLPGRERSLTIASAFGIQLHQHDGRTNRQTPRATAKTALMHSVAK